MPNGRHWCVKCGTMLIEWGEDCPMCGVPAPVAEGERELTAEEIIARTLAKGGASKDA